MALDRDALKRLGEAIGDSPEDLVDLLSSFLEEGPELLEVLNFGVLQGDAKAVRQAAHSLKSNARDFGAMEMARLCEGLENDLRANESVTDLIERVAMILAEWSEVETALGSEISVLSSAG